MFINWNWTYIKIDKVTLYLGFIQGYFHFFLNTPTSAGPAVKGSPTVLPMCCRSLDMAVMASCWQVKKTSASPLGLPSGPHSIRILDTTRGEKNCKRKTHVVKSSDLESSNTTSCDKFVVSDHFIFFTLTTSSPDTWNGSPLIWM